MLTFLIATTVLTAVAFAVISYFILLSRIRRQPIASYQFQERRSRLRNWLSVVTLLAILTGLLATFADALGSGNFSAFYDALSVGYASAVSAATAFLAGLVNALWRWLVPRRASNGRANHDYVASILNASPWLSVPAALDRELRAAGVI